MPPHVVADGLRQHPHSARAARTTPGPNRSLPAPARPAPALPAPVAPPTPARPVSATANPPPVFPARPGRRPVDVVPGAFPGRRASAGRDIHGSAGNPPQSTCEANYGSSSGGRRCAPPPGATPRSAALRPPAEGLTFPGPRFGRGLAGQPLNGFAGHDGGGTVRGDSAR